jgi:hypothetical protein
MSQLGHQRRFDVGGMSGIAPIATKLLRRDERRKGPSTDSCAATKVRGGFGSYLSGVRLTEQRLRLLEVERVEPFPQCH